MGADTSRLEHDLRNQREEIARLHAENERRQHEQQRMNDEIRERELMRAEAEKAGKEAEIRRMREEAENNRKMLEELQKAKEAEIRRIHEEAENNRKMLEELQKAKEEKRILEEKVKMDNLARQIAEEATARVEQEVWLRQEAQRNLDQGIPPIKYPSGDEIAKTRASLEYQEGFLHIAITGCSGAGKSSLINALRGYKNPRPGFASPDNFKGASNNTLYTQLAQTGTSETTTKIQRYTDPHDSRRNLALYDVPGAGTVHVRDWQYFNNQGLYIFDAIMIAIGDRITKTDVDLLFHCKRFGIPTFFVRSKADQHIRNSMEELDDDEADEGAVRAGYIECTRAEFSSLLCEVELPQQKIYIVSRETLRLLNDGKRPKPESIIDEEDLIKDIGDALHKWSAPLPTDKQSA